MVVFRINQTWVNDVIQASTKLLGTLFTSEKKSQELNTLSQAEDIDSSSSNMHFPSLQYELRALAEFLSNAM
ncbi:hypothetical protein V6N13_025262 [Hibiscus sabdariffa]